MTRSLRAVSPASGTTIRSACPRRARVGACTSAIQAAGAGRATASHWTGRPTSRALASARPLSPALAWPSERTIAAAYRRCACAASAASSARSRSVTDGIRSAPALPRSPRSRAADAPASAGSGAGGPTRPANSSHSKRRPVAAARSPSSASSAAACGTLSERSTSTSTRGRDRSSSQRTPASASSRTTRASTCRMVAVTVRGRIAFTTDHASASTRSRRHRREQRSEFPQQHECGHHQQRPRPVARLQGPCARRPRGRGHAVARHDPDGAFIACRDRDRIEQCCRQGSVDEESDEQRRRPGDRGRPTPLSSAVSISGATSVLRCTIRGVAPAASSTTSPLAGGASRPLVRSASESRPSRCVSLTLEDQIKGPSTDSGTRSRRKRMRGIAAVPAVPPHSTARSAAAASPVIASAGCVCSAARRVAGQAGSAATRRASSGRVSSVSASSAASASPGSSRACTADDIDVTADTVAEAPGSSFSVARVTSPESVERWRRALPSRHHRCSPAAQGRAGRDRPGCA